MTAANDSSQEVTLAVLGNKLDNISDQLAVHIEHFEKHVDKNEADFKLRDERIAEIAGWRREMIGAIIVVGFILTGVGAVLVKILIWGA